MPARAPLPVDDAIPTLRDALATRGAAVLVAPPGAGKTTVVPLSLMSEPWLDGRRVIMLEPRRLATRMAARRMADTLGERLGDSVGYRVRMDTRVSSRTRVEVVTEGIVTRMVQHDPLIPDVGLVIFDEFHERTLHADLALALVLHSRALVRDDLRVLVMSATLDAAPVARLLGGDHGDAPVVRSEGRIFPVETRYVEPRRDARVEATVASATLDALAREAGDLLVFLPGAGEIRRVAARLGDATLASGTRVVPLYGDLPPTAQDDAVRPSAPGARKVVLATSIAETSLTIEGVRVVIDSGLSRVPRFSPRTGMTSLETVRVSRASADQRRGRAGRVAPGVCYRLWAEHEQHHLLPQRAPEILEADLALLALELAAAGIDDPATLAWLDAPPAAALAQARELLAALDAIDGDGCITARGRRMAELPLHPRLAHMLLEGASLGAGTLACDLAALLEERDVLDDARDADVRLRLDALRGSRSAAHVDRVRRARESAAELRRLIGARDEPCDANAAGLLLAFAYPDRIGQRRGASGRFVLRNGTGAAFAEPQPLSESPFIVAAELDGRRPESRIYLAAPLDERELEAHFGEQIVVEETIAWDDDARAVVARRRTRLGAIVLADVVARDADPVRVGAALLDGIRRVGIAALPWSDAARRLRERLAFLHHLDATSWPDVSDDALARTADEWLAPHLDGLTRLDQLARLDLGASLLDHLAWSERAAIDEMAPTHVVVPSGSRVPIDYGDPAAPVLAVRLQEMFGSADTPCIARGHVPLTLHLLSPAHRPVQVTRDLAGFWRTTYFDVRKDLRGRYPKHHWPEDPLAAEATSRAKRRG